MTPKAFTSLLTLTLIASWHSPADADILLVHPDGSGPHPTIQAAIDAAVDGDEVVLTAGVFRGDGNREIRYHGKAITVRGSGLDCIIDPESGETLGFHPAFLFTEGEGPGSVLEWVTIQGGTTEIWDVEFPSVDLQGTSPTFRNCIFERTEGPMVRAIGGAPRFEFCTWRDIRCYSCGAPALQASEATLEYCEVVGNSSDGDAGIVSISKATIRELYMDESGSKWICGALVIGPGSLVENSSIHGYAGGTGSALCVTGPAMLRGCTVTGSGAPAVYAGGGCVLLMDCTIAQEDISPPGACVRRINSHPEPVGADPLTTDATSWGQIKANYK